MTNLMGSAKYLQRLKVVFAFFSLSSFMLGGWMLIAPDAFWQMMSVTGSNTTSQILYGGAICGEGVIFALGVWKPARYMTVIHYLIPYKLIGCAALVPRLVGVEPFPAGSWMIIGAWLSPAIIGALVYPWGKWEQCINYEIIQEHDF